MRASGDTENTRSASGRPMRRLMVRSGSDWNIVLARCITSVHGAEIAERAQSLRVDNFIDSFIHVG
jgi:hypothetical protein